LPPDFRIGGMRIEYKKQATLGDVVHVKQVELENGIQVWLCDDADDLYFIMDFYRNDEE